MHKPEDGYAKIDWQVVERGVSGVHGCVSSGWLFWGPGGGRGDQLSGRGQRWAMVGNDAMVGMYALRGRFCPPPRQDGYITLHN